ncbi:MAG: peptidyl-prolyl cis-trans isomerase [Leptothrix sp. (in: b-proteobacteria)]
MTLLSSPSPAATPGAATPSAPASFTLAWRTWLREPLLQFFIAGALLFGVDHLLFSRSDDPRTIVINADVDAELQQVFAGSSGRAPTATELTALRKAWLDNEILYREGLALRVDRGDPAIRERVIFKALSVVDANVKRPPVDGKVLREWFEAHRAKYDEPVRYDFQEAALAGETGDAAVLAFVQALNSGTPGDSKAGLRVFKGRPEASLAQSYGADFAKAMAQVPVGEWRALPTRDGLRAMRLEQVTPAKAADFEPLRGVVLQDWVDSVMSEQRSAAVRALGEKYTVRYEGSAP